MKKIFFFFGFVFYLSSALLSLLPC
ncbi:lipoprotein [uncultured Maritalea sp.]